MHYQCGQGRTDRHGSSGRSLISGRVAGAGLDVFEKEPPEYGKIFKLPNVVLTPHLGGNTVQAAQYMGRMAIDNLKAILDGRECTNQIKLGGK
ncbi:hypothetical protein DXA13_02010 [Clostridium sp. AM58-1XD]|nr:hypothetical protein DXA13_02010 [Clostridium sp. AM58-1XD]